MDSGLSQSDNSFCSRLNNTLQILFGKECNGSVDVPEGSSDFFFVMIDSISVTIALDMIIKILNIEFDKIIEITFQYPIQAHSKGIKMILKILFSSCSEFEFPVFNYIKYRSENLSKDEIKKELNNVCKGNQKLIKNDFNNLKKISLLIANLSEYIPKIEFEINKNHDSTGYILECNGFDRIELSFIEYLYNEFSYQISDIQLYGNQMKDRKFSIFLKSFQYEVLPKQGLKRFKSMKNKRKHQNSNNNNGSKKKNKT